MNFNISTASLQQMCEQIYFVVVVVMMMNDEEEQSK